MRAAEFIRRLVGSRFISHTDAGVDGLVGSIHVQCNRRAFLRGYIDAIDLDEHDTEDAHLVDVFNASSLHLVKHLRGVSTEGARIDRGNK